MLLLLFNNRLLARYCPPRASSSTGVGVRALAAHRQPLAVTDALVATHFHFAVDVLTNLAAQITLHLQVLVYVGTKPGYLLIGKILDPCVWRNLRLLTNPGRLRRTYAVNVCEGYDSSLLAGDVHPNYARHLSPAFDGDAGSRK